MVAWGGVAFILETRFRFATSSFCIDYIYQLYYSAEARKFTFKLRYLFFSLGYRVKFDGQKSKQTSFLIHDLCLGFRQVCRVRFVINIIFMILKSLFDIGLAVVQVYLAGLIL